MGNLHAGHLQLVKTAKKHADCVLVSLFVNPTQFSENEDLDSYPRTLQQDIEKLEGVDTDILFTPSESMMYPRGGDNTTHVHVPQLTNILCGASRPNHFDGVTTIVNKLFNITRADIAVFGEKDYQQLAVIRRMVEDLNIPIRIIGEPIVRETDGLAMSSRNGYLSADERRVAPALQQVLLDMKQSIIEGEKDFASLELKGKSQLIEQGFKPDYLHIYHRDQLRPANIDDNNLIVIVAAFIGNTRLIDNLNVTCNA
jgi:pantoate--beta-alanine ligase